MSDLLQMVTSVMLLRHKFLLYSSYTIYATSQQEQSSVLIVSHRNVEKHVTILNILEGVPF